MACRHHRRIFVLSTEPRYSKALKTVAARRAAIVRQFPSPQDCLRHLSKTPCDVLIIDLDGPGETVDTLTQARQLWPWQTSIVLVPKGEVSHAILAMKAGATDCLEEPLCHDHLLSAIEEGLSRTAALFASDGTFTQTQSLILRLILAGKTSSGIARQLGRSKRTIDFHREKIYRKAGVSDLLGMVMWAYKAGLLIL